MHQTNTYFCDEFLQAVYFQIKRAKKYLKKKFEIDIISVFDCTCFLRTLRFDSKSFAVCEDSKVRKKNLKVICLKYHEVRKHFLLFFHFLFLFFYFSSYNININEM